MPTAWRQLLATGTTVLGMFSLRLAINPTIWRPWE